LRTLRHFFALFAVKSLFVRTGQEPLTAKIAKENRKVREEIQIEPPPVLTPARVPSGKPRIIIRLPAQARGISEPHISNNDKVGESSTIGAKSP
jgi:hypothetical protein